MVDLGGEHPTESEALVTALKQLGGESLSETYQSSQLYGADHVIAPKGMTVSMLQARQRANSTVVAILYGAMGSPGFKELHDTLMQGVERGERSPACSGPRQPCHPGDTSVRRRYFNATLRSLICWKRRCASRNLDYLGLVIVVVTYQVVA